MATQSKSKGEVSNSQKSPPIQTLQTLQTSSRRAKVPSIDIETNDGENKSNDKSFMAQENLYSTRSALELILMMEDDQENNEFENSR